MHSPHSPRIISGGDDSTPTTPIPHKHKSCLLSRIPTLTELQFQYNVDIARLSSLNPLDLDSELSNTETLSIHSIDTQRSGIQHKLEKTWTLMLSHISRMDTASAVGHELEFEYLQDERKIQNQDDAMSSTSSSKRVQRRKSFFNGVGLCDVEDDARSVLEDQSLYTRLMNISTIRWLYHFGTRASSFSDQISDLILFVSLLLAGATNHYLKYLCILIMPYIVLSILLLAPLTRRSKKLSSLLFTVDAKSQDEDVELSGQTQKLRIVPTLMTPFWLPVYLAIMVPYLISLDFYIYFRLMGKDLATTRYLLYYWRLKTIVEILFEAIPQTVFLLTADLSNVNPILIIFGLCSSIGLFCWSMFQIYEGGKQTYLEAIVQNNLIELTLKDDSMRVSEWKHMAKSLFYNYSVQKLYLHDHSHIPPKVWSLLFYSLENNRLNTIALTSCHLMGTKPISTEKAQEMTGLNDIDLATVVTDAFSKKADHFNPFDKVNHDDESAALDHNQVRFTRLIVLYSLQRVVRTSALSLQYIQLTENNLSSLAPLLLNTISQCCALETLDLSSNCLGMCDEDDLRESFSNLIKECTQLQTLILNDNGLGDAFAKIFISILSDSLFTQKSDSNAQEQPIKNDKYMASADDINIALGLVDEGSNLKLLSLENNELTLFGAKTLFKACSAHNITINLEQNNIDTQQWMRLMGTTLLNAEDLI
eukprot:418063_1